MIENDDIVYQQIEELKRKIAVRELALTATDVHFTVHDREGRYLYVNPVGLAAQGMTAEDVYNKTWRDLGFPEEVGVHFDQRLEKVFTEAETIVTEVEFPSVQGMRIFETVLSPAFDDDGKVVAAVSTHQDITEIRETAEALRESNAELQKRTEELASALYTARYLRDQAERANQAKDTFLANMSHELRTPLNAILGYAQLMTRDSQVTPTQQKYLATIARSGEHLLDLINDVLTMSKIESGRSTLQENAFNLHRLIYDLQDMFSLRAEEKGISLILDIASDVPAYVNADEGKLRQVLLNLLSNAVKFTDEGGVALRVGVKRESTESVGAMLLIEVEDTGHGIASAEMHTLFEPFVQTATGQLQREGTGLGLPICKRFVDLMGGELSVNSIVEQGSIFRVQIPVTIITESEFENSDVHPLRQITGVVPGQTAPDGDPFRFLVVEDNIAGRDLLMQLLTPFGFDVRVAENGAEGVALWEQWQPHLVWMDIRMPVMDGFEATSQIKARAETMGREVIIVALTASAFEEDRDAILAAGCDDFIRKPYREQEIFDVLQRHLGIQFIYANEVSTSTPDRESSLLKKSPEELQIMFAAVPAGWCAELKQAAILLDAQQMLNLINDIRLELPSLADTLAQWVQRFEYDKVIAFCQRKLDS